MDQQLKKSFFEYLELTEKHFKEIRNKTSSSQKPQSYLREKDEIKRRVNILESHESFQKLQQSVKSHLPNIYANMYSGISESPLKTFFRKSGVYINFYEGNINNYDDLYTKLVNAYEADQILILHLAPIYEIDFTGNLMDFGKFQIRKFSYEELEELCFNKVNRIFYEYAVVKTEELMHNWYICVSETVPITRRVPPVFFLTREEWVNDVAFVEFEYSDFLESLNYPLKFLALYSWSENPEAPIADKETPKSAGWTGFSIPFTLEFYQSLVDSPLNPPPHFGPETAPDYIETVDGAFEIDSPYYGFIFDKKETIKFKEYIQSNIDMTSAIDFEGNNWRFWERALRFLTKAFFINTPEQLLWHISALEAILGQDVQGLTTALGCRISNILGNTDEERKIIKKQFKKIYDLRSRIIHGSQIENEIYWLHLRQARIFARRVLVWFLHLLFEIQKNLPEDTPPEKIPTRENILNLIDFDNRTWMEFLKNTLPETFPNVDGWK